MNSRPTFGLRIIAVAALASLLLSGCSLLPKYNADETAGWSAQKLYSKAKSNLADGNYQKAIQYFETLEGRYPYGPYAEQAQLDVAYAYWKDEEPASAVAAADRFIRLHPSSPYVDYAYYLKGLANFNGTVGLFGGMIEQNPSQRDPRAAKESFEAFKELVTRYPKSKYAPDALARMKYLVNVLAMSDIDIAKYYYTRKAYVAAANRAKAAVENYPQAPARQEALAIMAESYGKLGITQLRDDAYAVLKLNYPNSPYLTHPVNMSGRPWYQFW